LKASAGPKHGTVREARITVAEIERHDDSIAEET
jgi:hypothetical protein